MSKKSHVKHQVPNHLGLILDGNRRWAKSEGVHKLKGHKAGYGNLKTIAEVAWDRGVKIVSAYIFSTENWDRSKSEVEYLMNLTIWVVDNDLQELERKGVKIVCSGSMEGVSKKVQKAVYKAVERTKDNKKGILNLCFNYGGHRELVDAIKTIVKTSTKPEDIDEEFIAKHLYHPELPPVDFIIRTSGEQRLSNFMLWRAAYSELYFPEMYWPDFTEKDLDEALEEYGVRHRRFGS